MEKLSLHQYQHIIAYGIGQNYFQAKDRLKDITFDFLMDEKWEDTSDKVFQGIPIIRSSEVDKMEKTIIIVFPSNEAILNYVKRKYNCDVCHISDLFSIVSRVTGEQLRANLLEKRYEDENGNIIEYNDLLPKNININFYGYNNRIKFGNNICISERLYILCGNNGIVMIGNNTTIISAEIHVACASVIIGDDCMFSRNIVIRNDDNHHIFDLSTGKRINKNEDVVIGRQVWIGQGAVILSGANIGDGSIVGENGITSSIFPDHVIIAGSPAKVIRDNICWSRDNTLYFNRETLDDCIDQNAKKYI